MGLPKGIQKLLAGAGISIADPVGPTTTVTNTGGGGGGVGQTLMLSYNGVGPFSVPVSSLPADWSGDGNASMLAQLTTGADLIAGLQDENGNDIPDGWTFPALIFVEGSEIFDIIALNAFTQNAAPTGGITWWGPTGGSASATLSLESGENVLLSMTGGGAFLISTGQGGDNGNVPLIMSAGPGTAALQIWNGNPNGNTAAFEAGDLCIDVTTPALWQATAADDSHWVQFGSAASPFIPGSTVSVDLGLVNLVDAVMNGPTTLFEMPEGSFLASIRYTDDPATVAVDNFPISNVGPDSNVTFAVVFGTVKSFGWSGFAWSTNPESLFYDNVTAGNTQNGSGYGPIAALDLGGSDINTLVLSAASVGPIQCGLRITDTENVSGSFGRGSGVRADAITAWSAATNYDSPASNTVATPGVLQKCAILENGTIWINDGTTGTSGGSAPDFAGNAGGSVTDGGTAASVLADAPPTLPTTIITGTNDTFLLNSETFTLAAGVLTTEADAIAAMGAALGSDSGEAFSTKVTPSDSSGSILATAVLGESVSNGSTIAEGNGAAAILGFTANPDTFAGGTGIVWYDTTSAPPTVGAVHAVAEIVTPWVPS